jgi:hypothetical protein
MFHNIRLANDATTPPISLTNSPPHARARRSKRDIAASGGVRLGREDVCQPTTSASIDVRDRTQDRTRHQYRRSRLRIGTARLEHNESALPQPADVTAEFAKVRVGPEADVGRVCEQRQSLASQPFAEGSERHKFRHQLARCLFSLDTLLRNESGTPYPTSQKAWPP